MVPGDRSGGARRVSDAQQTGATAGGPGNDDRAGPRADADLHPQRAQDARPRPARLSAVPRRLEQGADRARRDRRRLAALPDRRRARHHRRHGHVQGGRRRR